MAAANEQSQRIAGLVGFLTSAEYMAADENWLAVLRHLGNLGDAFSELAADLCQLAYDGGATKKAIAEALNMPVGALRGLVRS